MDSEENLPVQATIAPGQASLEQEANLQLSSNSGGTDENIIDASPTNEGVTPSTIKPSEESTASEEDFAVSATDSSETTLEDETLKQGDKKAGESNEDVEKQNLELVEKAEEIGEDVKNENVQPDKKAEESNEGVTKKNIQPTRRTTRTRKANTKYIEEDLEEGSKEDPSFTPDDGEYFEGSLEVSEESEAEFAVGKAKKKPKSGGRGRKRSASKTPRTAKKKVKTPKGRGRKPAAVKSRSNNQSLTTRSPRRKTSKTTYFEEDSDNSVASDEDYKETFSDHKPAAKRSHKKSTPKKPQKVIKNSPPSARRRSTPRRESANHRSYDESLLDESSDDDELPLVDGQPQLKAQKPKKRQRHSQSSDPNEGMDEQLEAWNSEEQGGRSNLKQESCFMVKKDSNAALQSVILSNGQAHLSEDLYIWKQEGQLLQKFARVGDSLKFKGTSNYLGFFAESKNDYLPVNVWSLAKEKATEIVRLKGPFDSNGDADVPESHRIKNSMESGMAGKPSKAQNKTGRRDSSDSYEPTRKRGRPCMESTDFVAEPTTTRKPSIQDDSATPRRRGRPRKNPVVAIERLGEPMESSEAKSEEDMKPSFVEYVKVLLKQIGLGKNHLDGMDDVDQLKLLEIDNLLQTLCEKVISITGLKADYLEALMSQPCMLQESNSDGQPCQAISDGSSAAATLVVQMSGKAYARNVLAVIDDEADIANRFLVSDAVGKISQAYHNLWHFKFHLFHKCAQKFKETASKTYTAPSTPGNQATDVGEATESISDVNVKSAVNDVLFQVMQQSCLVNIGSGEVVDEKIVTPDMPVKSVVQSCLMDKAWIDQLYDQFLTIIDEADHLLTTPRDAGDDVIAPV